MVCPTTTNYWAVFAAMIQLINMKLIMLTQCVCTTATDKTIGLKLGAIVSDKQAGHRHYFTCRNRLDTLPMFTLYCIYFFPICCWRLQCLSYHSHFILMYKTKICKRMQICRYTNCRIGKYMKIEKMSYTKIIFSRLFYYYGMSVRRSTAQNLIRSKMERVKMCHIKNYLTT